MRPTQTVDDGRLIRRERQGLFDIVQPLLQTVGAICQRITERVQRMVIFRVFFDDAQQIVFGQLQIVETFRDQGPRVQQIMVARRLGQHPIVEFQRLTQLAGLRQKCRPPPDTGAPRDSGRSSAGPAIAAAAASRFPSFAVRLALRACASSQKSPSPTRS